MTQEETTSEGTGTPNVGTEIPEGETGTLTVDDPNLPEAPAIEDEPATVNVGVEDDGPGKVIASYQVRVNIRATEGETGLVSLTNDELAATIGAAIRDITGNNRITVRAERLDK